MIVEVEGVALHLSHPVEYPAEWIGQEEVLRELLAAWMTLGGGDLPMNPRITGKPGVGKTTLAYTAARRLGREVYIMQGTVDTRPEDLIVQPVVEGPGTLRYVASPLVTAMLRGGVAILDEANRMPEKSWASLAPLLDARRYVESIVAGIKIPAHPDFRLVCTMNEDASTFDLPEYIFSRLQPQIHVDFPEQEQELEILRQNLPLAEEEVLYRISVFLQAAHEQDEPYTVRDGINIGRYAMRLVSAGRQPDTERALRFAIRQVLGEEALRYVG
jgi:MoxR-like ATPase